MATQHPSFDPALTIFFLVKTSPEWLSFPFETRLEHGRGILQPILDEFAGRVRLRWYDVEFYTARVTDIWMIEARDHRDYQLFCEKLRDAVLGPLLPGQGHPSGRTERLGEELRGRAPSVVGWPCRNHSARDADLGSGLLPYITLPAMRQSVGVAECSALSR